VAPPAGSAAGDATNKLDHSGDIYVKRTRKKGKLKAKRKVFAVRTESRSRREIEERVRYFQTTRRAARHFIAVGLRRFLP
jgi:hypothetical protein